MANYLKHKSLQEFYFRSLSKGADVRILDRTMSLDVKGNYEHCLQFSATEAKRYLIRRYKQLLKSIKSNTTITTINTSIYN